MSLEVNRQVGVRTRRTASEALLLAALQFAQERLVAAVSAARGRGGDAGEPA
ncbi:hypothetical protein [Lentzea sp. NPDC059081]|uniref:hypothetical protein n=1 Tax=Lentzea sp. NPDC059081 TaxID=3346719 RepID=UPI00368101AB